MFDLFPQILIFLSLAVIIFIFGKKIPQLRDLSRRQNLKVNVLSNKNSKTKTFFSSLIGIIRNGFVFALEWIVKKAKKLLHLVHFWLIKVKRGKKDNEMISEIEAKQELIAEEERSLEKVINEDLVQSQDEISVYKKEEVSFDITNNDGYHQEVVQIKKQELVEVDYSPEQEQHNKVQQFFTNQQQPEAEGSAYSFKEEELNQLDNQINDQLIQEQAQPKQKKSIWSKIFKRKSIDSNDLYSSGYAEEAGSNTKPLLTDGVVSVMREPNNEIMEPINTDNNLMKEVVAVKKNQKVKEVDLDEELGVDRRILEKKIIQKITKNPRDIENYRQLGELYIKMKEYADAEESYKQVLKISIRDIDAKRKLEKIKLLKRLS